MRPRCREPPRVASAACDAAVASILYSEPHHRSDLGGKLNHGTFCTSGSASGDGDRDANRVASDSSALVFLLYQPLSPSPSPPFLGGNFGSWLLGKNVPGIPSEACSRSHARAQLTAEPWRPEDTTTCLHPPCSTTCATSASSRTATRQSQPPTPPRTRPSSHGSTPRKAKIGTNEVASIEHIGGASSEPAKSLGSAWS